eukprot:TRINITY_DN9168_c0_g1_i1.p1 TRINITY_DN9168_c0_g1~~TRINITY_DN9168_c0_g1_i1.p1  ORF type:complete len:153 (-),score=28.24 TRINITY_DN9168_c0_g1_i1:36-494(-)
MERAAPGWICAGGQAAGVRQKAIEELSFQSFEADLGEKASQGRRMVHNERFLHRTLRDTASHNRRQSQHTGAGNLLTASLKQLDAALASAPAEDVEPAGRVKVTIKDPGSMGLRMQPGPDGRPVVVSVSARSAAAAQGVTPGLSLRLSLIHI